jgi:beta-lactam-binding protein with PASTA domain
MQTDSPLSFSVTAAGGNVKLDESGEAKASFTVTNGSSQAVTGELLAKPRDPAKAEWFSIAGESIREFTPNGAEGVVVKVDIPPGSPPGSYAFRLDAVNENDPDEDYTEGPFVAFDVAQPAAPKKKFPWWILVLVGGIILLAVIGVVVWLLASRDKGPKPVATPAVIGLSARGAESILTNAGFTVKTLSVPVSDQTQNGLVQSQDPAGGSAQPPGTAVTISVGHISLVPPLKGLTQAKAKAALADADLKVTVRSEFVEDGAKRDVVIEQDPASGSFQRPGTVVTITVGRNAEVPDLMTGLTQAQAEAILDKAGFKSTVKFVPFTGEQFRGIVSDQIPLAGTIVEPGSVVEIHVNRDLVGGTPQPPIVQPPVVRPPIVRPPIASPSPTAAIHPASG